MKHTARILIIEDDRTFSRILDNYLKKNNFHTDLFLRGEEALKAFQENSYDLVLTDFRLPDRDGLQVLAEVKASNPKIPVILMTGFSDIRTAVKAIKLGAFEYIVKPVNPEELLLTLQHALAGPAPQEEANKPKSSKGYKFDYIQGQSQEAKQIQQQIELVAPTDMSVIVLGESGTGKEYVSRMIHSLSARADQPFVAIDCGTLSDDLAASELFGHMKGAFTGALQDKVGHFEEANGGTIFMDEIGNLSYEVQIKLLRAIQERVIKRVGGNQDIPIDVRIIVATNEDLSYGAKSGSFREDLYHRLNEFSIKISPLRERKDDILLYADSFLENANQDLGKSVRSFDEKVEQIFTSYYWPGNLRELKNIIKRAVLLAKTNQITTECLPPELVSQALTEPVPIEKKSETDLKKIQEQNERELILKTLLEVRYNKSKAARLLGIDRKTLYNKIDKYGIEA